MDWKFEFNIEIIKKGHDLIVMKDGVEIRSFHEISDDYAYTNAKAYARTLVWEERKKRDRKEANTEILNILGQYLFDNPDQRFGQALRNIGIVEEDKDILTAFHQHVWVNGFYEEPQETLKRIKERK